MNSDCIDFIPGVNLYIFEKPQHSGYTAMKKTTTAISRRFYAGPKGVIIIKSVELDYSE